LNLVIRNVEGDDLAAFRTWAEKYPDRVVQRDRLMAFMKGDLGAGPVVEEADATLTRVQVEMATAITGLRSVLAQAEALTDKAANAKPGRP
jgi:hypothetical protein